MKKIIFVIGICCVLIASINYSNIIQKQWTIKVNTAISNGDIKKVKELLANEKMDINKKDGSIIAWFIGGNECSYSTPFETALYSNNLDMINLLLDHGADPYVDEQEVIGWILSSVSDGTWRERHECVNKIIESDSSGDYYDADGCVVLTGIAGELAVEENTNHYSVERAIAIKELYELASNKYSHESDKDGTTVLHAATAHGRNLVLIKYFVEECNYSVNIKNFEEETPLIYMLKYYDSEYENDCNMYEIVKYFVSNSVDVQATDANGKTAYDYAIEMKRGDIAELVRP